MRNSWTSRLGAGLVAGAMISFIASSAIPVRADDTTTPATTAPDGSTPATPSDTTTPVTPVATPAVPVPLSKIKTILLFPVVNKAGDAYNSSAGALGLAVKLKTNSAGLGRFTVTTYAPYMPSIQRALNVEDTLSQAELTPPFNDPTRARKIAQIVGTDGFAIVSLDSETIDDATGNVKLAATMSLYASAYGDPIRTYPVTGSSAKVTPSQDVATVEENAIQATASNLVRSLTKDAGTTSDSPPSIIKHASGTGKHSNGGNSFLMVLLTGLMVGVVASAAHSSHGTSSGGTVNSGLPGGDQLGGGGGGSTSGSGGPPGGPSIP